MKFCDLTQFYSPVSGGVKRYIEQKVAYLRKYRPGDEHLLIIPGEKTEQIGDDVARVYLVKSPLISRTSRYRALFRLGVVEEILEREKPDLIESGDPYQVAWKAVVSGRALGIPAVGFYHSHFPEAYIRSVAKYFGRYAVRATEEFAKHYIHSLYNHFARTMVPSPALAGLLREWGVENVVNTDLGVDTDIFVPGEAPAGLRRELAVPDAARLLLYVGRLASEKNVKTLFSAFELLNEAECGRWHLLAIGDGTQRASLQALRDRTGAVTWLPYCSDAAQLADYYRVADLFVHPGICETFGLVTLESQASGTPVVGIKGSYMDRIIFTNQSHWAAENTPEALAAAIRENGGHDLRAAGLAASATVRARYSWRSVFDRLFGIYEQVIGEYSP